MDETERKRLLFPVNNNYEVWHNFTGNLWISNFGELVFDDGDVKYKVHTNVTDTGYRYYNREGKKPKVHIQVAESFLGQRPVGCVIDHIDRNKLNNKVSNLRYVVYSENSRNTEKYRHDIPDQNINVRRAILRKESAARKRQLKIEQKQKELEEQQLQEEQIENVIIDNPKPICLIDLSSLV